MKIQYTMQPLSIAAPSYSCWTVTDRPPSPVAADAENIEIPALDFARATPFLAKPYVRFAF